MSEINNSVFMRALRRESVARTPVWVMRQAGRYLPEYRKIRAQAGDFMTLCQNPELACEVTLQPLRRFELDAAIVFSDILTIPAAMGLGLHFESGEGPRFRYPLGNQNDIDALPELVIEESLAYVMNAIRLIRQEMPAHLPLLGFAGSPWTLACYMLEGKGSKSFSKAMTLMQQQPMLMHQLLQKLCQTTIAYLCAQAEAGANALMIFDTWGGMLATPEYLNFSLQYLKAIVAGIQSHHPNLPVILFTKGGGQWLEQLAATGCDALGLDWTCSLNSARARVGHKVALQGNLNPKVLLESADTIKRDTKAVLESFGHGSGHIFNLGHGITPEVKPDSLKIMLETVHQYSTAYHTE